MSDRKEWRQQVDRLLPNAANGAVVVLSHDPCGLDLVAIDGDDRAVQCPQCHTVIRARVEGTP